METTETSERTGLGAEMLYGCAHFGCNRLLLDKEEVGFDNLGLLGFVILREERSVDFIGLFVFSLESCCGRSLDHGQSSYDITVGVGDLEVVISVADS